MIEAIPDDAWTPIPYWLADGADVAETTYTPFAGEPDAAPVRLIVRRVRPTPGSQLSLLILYDYHAFITDRDGETLELEADHRRHAEIRTRSATSSTGRASTTCRRAGSRPTAPGWRSRCWPTISPAGPPASVWAQASSRPRPSADGCLASLGG